MERSFANAKRYGFDRFRWRGLDRISIQEYLVCAIQNIKCLIKPKTTPKLAVTAGLEKDVYENPHEMSVISDIKQTLNKKIKLIMNYVEEAQFIGANKLLFT